MASRFLSGNAWVSSSTCFCASSNCWKTNPVMLPPGRAKLAIYPRSNGSKLMAIMTTGMNPVAPTTACKDASGPTLTIKSGGERIKSTTATKGARIVQAFVVDCQVLAVAKPELRQLRTKGLVLIDRWGGVEGWPEETQPNKPLGLLRARTERPRCRTAEERDELASQWIEMHSVTTRLGKAAG